LNIFRHFIVIFSFYDHGAVHTVNPKQKLYLAG
jgi:hypothetical protein